MLPCIRPGAVACQIAEFVTIKLLAIIAGK
jgi:hypothetical protein